MIFIIITNFSMESLMESPKINNDINIESSIPYVKENSTLLKFIEKFKETNPELFAIKEKVFSIAFFIGISFLLVKKFHFIYMEI